MKKNKELIMYRLVWYNSDGEERREKFQTNADKGVIYSVINTMQVNDLLVGMYEVKNALSALGYCISDCVPA